MKKIKYFIYKFLQYFFGIISFIFFIPMIVCIVAMSYSEDFNENAWIINNDK